MKRRRRRRIWLALPLLVLAALVLAWRSLLPAIEDLAAAEATDEASDLIAEAITAQMELEDISYDDLIVLERDAGGRILALRTDMNQLGRLRNETLAIINERILDEGETELGVPLGSILLPALFSGKGPRLPVRVLTVSNSDAEFHSSFQAAGINQTMHRITKLGETPDQWHDEVLGPANFVPMLEGRNFGNEPSLGIR